MQTVSNEPASFAALVVSVQAREILEKLSTNAGSGNDELFYHWLAKIGLGISSRDLGTLLDRLGTEALVSSEMVERTRVLRLTLRGQEVARGIEVVAWIARPEPIA